MSISELFWNFLHFIHKNRIIMRGGHFFFVHLLYIATVFCLASDYSLLNERLLRTHMLLFLQTSSQSKRWILLTTQLRCVLE